MIRIVVTGIVGLAMWSVALSTPIPKEGPRITGILVLDNCDPKYKDKDAYEDNLTLVDFDGKKTFRLSGFNNCESIACSRMIATDPSRKCIWVIENVAHRIRRFDLTGKETLAINGVDGSAIAVDPETGNVWALANKGQIGTGKTVVFNDKGKEVASYEVSGWDIAYDKKAKAFWIVDHKLTKITDKGEIVFSDKIASWCVSSIDIDPQTGNAWVLFRVLKGKGNPLVKFDPKGKELAAITLGERSPFRVSVDAKDGSVWVAHLGKSIERFSSEGKSEAVYEADALGVQVDPSGKEVWVVTPEEIQKWTSKGEIVKRIKHASKSSQAWIAALE
jgi:DNA-binding beta-propeller fold protein YncE